MLKPDDFATHGETVIRTECHAREAKMLSNLVAANLSDCEEFVKCSEQSMRPTNIVTGLLPPDSPCVIHTARMEN